MSFILTPDNYFSPLRPHISVSMIKDYMKCPAFYKRRYIDRDPKLQIIPSDAMKRGSIVDDILTRGKTNIQPKVKKNENPSLFEEQKTMDERKLVGQSYWDEAVEIVESLKEHPLWKPGKEIKTQYQVLLDGKLCGMPVCGMADRIDIHSDGSIEIIDLKVVSSAKIESAQKWLWNVMEMKYGHQFALYKFLYQQFNTADISCRHVVASYIEPGLVQIKSYKLPQILLDEAFSEIEGVLNEIKKGIFDKKTSEIEELFYI